MYLSYNSLDDKGGAEWTYNAATDPAQLSYNFKIGPKGFDPSLIPIAAVIYYSWASWGTGTNVQSMVGSDFNCNPYASTAIPAPRAGSMSGDAVTLSNGGSITLFSGNSPADGTATYLYSRASQILPWPGDALRVMIQNTGYSAGTLSMWLYLYTLHQAERVFGGS